MPTATVTVRWVNQPKEGRKLGSIKTDDNQLFGVWPETLGEFKPNGIYEIEYTERHFDDGKIYKTVKTVAPKGMAPPRPAGNRFSGPRETSMKDAERMFVCSLLNAAIQSGKVEFSGAKLEAAVNGLRSVWANTFAAEPKPPEAIH
jgi:hypothetical protein